MNKKVKRITVINISLYVVEALLLFLWLLTYLYRINDKPLWIQGRISVGIDYIVWMIFCITVIAQYIWKYRMKKADIYLMIIVGAILIGIISVMLGVPASKRDYFYYEEDDQTILVVKSTKLFVTKSTRFYSKKNVFLTEEVAMCYESFAKSCNYRIEDNKLIITLLSDGDVEETIYILPE